MPKSNSENLFFFYPSLIFQIILFMFISIPRVPNKNLLKFHIIYPNTQILNLKYRNINLIINKL